MAERFRQQGNGPQVRLGGRLTDGCVFGRHDRSEARRQLFPIEDPADLRPALERAVRYVLKERKAALVDVVTQAR